MKFFKRKKSSPAAERKIASWKKWVARAGVVAMAIAATLFPAKQSVFAASIYKNYVGVYYNGTVAGMVSYNGTPAYCIQMESHMPAPGGYNGQSGNVYSTTATEAYSGLSSDLKRRITAITYFGYGYGGRDSIVYYYGAQQAIWDLQGYPNIRWSGSVSTSSVQAAKNEILADVNSYLNNTSKQPSFVIKDSAGNTVGSAGADSYFDRAVIGKTYTITDVNGYLSSSTVTKNEFGSRAKISGNTITVTMDESDYLLKRAITVSTGGESLPQRGAGVVLYAGSYQNLITVSTPSASANSATVVLRGFGVPVEFTKKNENGQALAGAQMSLYKINSDNSETLIESYTSTGGSKHFDLCPGNYKMVENTPPVGYYKSKPVTFTVAKKPNETQYFEMADAPIKLQINKISTKDGSAVIGAKLKMTESRSNTVISEWYTTADDKCFEKEPLVAGASYRISETEAAQGYYDLADDIWFTIPEYKPEDSDSNNGFYIVDVGDVPIDYRIAKVDNDDTSKFIPGATLQLKHGDTVLAEWVTTTEAYEIDHMLLTMGETYTIHELKAPPGYYAAPTDTSFTVDKHYRGDVYTVNVKDVKISSYIQKVDDEGAAVAGATLSIKDKDGNEIDRFTSTLEKYELKNLVDGAAYTVEELEAPKGYYRAETPVTFTMKAPSAEAQMKEYKVSFENPAISYSVQKVDVKTKKLLAGATLQIIDDETNQQVGEDIVSKDDGPVAIPNTWLTAGKSYTVHESKPAAGYYYSSEDKHFTVPATVEEAKKADKSSFTITVEDPEIRINIAKKDKDTEEYVGGAKLAIYKEATDTEPLYTWESSKDEPLRISDYITMEAGHTYYVRELYDVPGYYLNESAVPVNVPTNFEDDMVLTFDFYNTPIEWNIKKTDMNDNLLTTSPNGSFFTLEVYDTQETLDDTSDDGTPIATLCTNDATYKSKGYFDMEEYIKQGLVRGGHHYRIHEAGAADGYRLTSDITVEINPAGTTNTIITSVQDDEIRIRLRKADEKGNVLTTVKTIDGEQGFVLTIYDEDTGEEVFTIDTSDEEYQKNGYVDVSKYLSSSKNYVVKETAQPIGYYKAKDVSFTVDSFSADNSVLKLEEVESNGKKLQVGVITMIDPKINAEFRKENNVGDVIFESNGEGFEFQIFDTKGTDDISDDEVVGVINTMEMPHNEAGYIEIGQFLQEATKYRIHESYVPSGYAYSQEDAYITTPGYYNESEGSVQNVIIQFN